MEHTKTYTALLKELEETRYRLEEANETIGAIRSGQVDALIIHAGDGHQLYTLESADAVYRIFIEQMTEGAVTLNAEGDILYCNSRFALWMELPLEQVIGQSFSRFVEPSCRKDWEKLFAKAWKRSSKGELSIRSDQQNIIPVTLSFNVLDVGQGPTMSIIITDLILQKHTQHLLEQKNDQLIKTQEELQLLNASLEDTVNHRTRELYKNQERLSRILETMAEGVGITDLQGNIIYANPMAQQILGLQESEIKTRTYDDKRWENLRIDGTPLPGEEHPMFVTMKTGKPVYDFEIGVKPPDSELFYISINAAPLFDEDGRIIGGIGTFMDVTNRRKSIQQQDEFISIASHELKTPITSLKASLQLLERIKDNPSATILPKLIDQSNKSLNKVSILIDDLLNATKITEGQLVLNQSQFKISALLNDCCQHVRNGGIYTILTEGDEELDVYADADKIEQVMVNFVNNAVKYAPESKTIYIRFGKQDTMLKVEVTDHGPGIQPEKLPYLFERYYRVERGGRQYSGLGLGLYISAEIIKKHGGRIGADSRPGEGSTFWFTLPLTVPA